MRSDVGGVPDADRGRSGSWSGSWELERELVYNCKNEYFGEFAFFAFGYSKYNSNSARDCGVFCELKTKTPFSVTTAHTCTYLHIPPAMCIFGVINAILFLFLLFPANIKLHIVAHTSIVRVRGKTVQKGPLLSNVEKSSRGGLYRKQACALCAVCCIGFLA